MCSQLTEPPQNHGGRAEVRSTTHILPADSARLGDGAAWSRTARGWTGYAHSRSCDRPLRGMAVRSDDDGPAGGGLLVVGQDSESFECDVEVGFGGPAGGRVLRQGADQGECLGGRDVATGPAFALGPIP